MTAIKRRIFALIFGMAFLFLLMVSTVLTSHHQRKNRIVIGAKDTTGQILAEILTQFFREKSHLNIESNPNYGGTFICFHALSSNEIDMYLEYTGTALSSILRKEWTEIPPNKTFDFLNREFKIKFGFQWMQPLGFESSYVILVRSDFAMEHHLKSISDLKNLIQRGKEISFAFDPEFYARPEMKVLETGYELSFKQLELLDHPLIYMALENNGVDVINGYATDGFIASQGLVILEDDLSLFPPYQAAAIVREDILKKYPELFPLFEEISGRITLPKMSEMNYRVEKNKESVYHVARQFLIRESLISHP